MSSNKYILFRVRDKFFCLRLLVLKEVILHRPVESLPRATKNVKGIINLRGKIIPIVNMAKVLSIDPPENEKPNLLVIDSKKSDSQYGFEVDEVIEVTNIDKKQLQSQIQSENQLKNFTIAVLTNHKNHTDKVIYVLNDKISDDEDHHEEEAA